MRDLIALAWIPLVIDLPVDIKIAPQNIYRNKGECAKLFDQLMSDPAVSKPTGGEYTHELHNTAVHSALAVAGQLPKLYDKIYVDFPYAYNDTEGKFGRISVGKASERHAVEADDAFHRGGSHA